MEYLAPKGTYRDPFTRHCWKTCGSCGRCENKGSRSQCNGCSGRVDDLGQKVPHIDDRCRCTEGILQLVNKDGKMFQVRMPRNPFAGTVTHEAKSQDEQDYEAYLNEQREKFDNPNWDAVTFDDGGSVQDWSNSRRG